MAKKQLTIRQQKNKYRAIEISTFLSQYVAIASPYAVLCAINWDKWFMSNPDATKVGIGGAIAIVLVSVATLLVSRKKEDDSKTSGYIVLILAWLVAAFIFKLLASIMLEIADIMLISSTGLIGAFGLDQTSKYAKKKADNAKNTIETSQKQLDVEQATKEIIQEKEKKIVIKVKK